MQFRTTSKDDSEVVSDIDKFLSNVRTIQRGHAVRNLEATFNNFGNRATFNVEKSKLQEKVNTWQCGDREDTVPNLGAGKVKGDRENNTN